MDGNLWTFNDGGNSATLYRLDSATGTVLQQISISNYGNTDWEDITSDADYIYIGDFGNNKGMRQDLKILKIAKADIPANGNTSVTAEAINYSYPDQTTFTTNDKNNFDCESIISIGDSLYLFSKNLGNYQTRLYSLPKAAGTYSANLITQYDVKGKITAASINPSNSQIALLGYLSNHTGSFILLLDDFSDNNFFSGTIKRVPIIDHNVDWQTEGISYFNDNRIFISCESTNAVPVTLYAADYAVINNHILSVPKTASKADIEVYPNPSLGSVFVNTTVPVLSFTIYNILGATIHQQVLANGANTHQIDLSNHPKGLYTIELKTILGSYFERIILK